MPILQLVQAVERPACWLNFPESQFWQVLSPVDFPIFPGSQFVQTEAPASVYFPLPQGEHAVRPAEAPTSPARHEVHALIPVAAPYIPLIQLIHGRFALAE